jgi:magnesium transporter
VYKRQGGSLGIILGVIVIGVALAFVGQAAIAFTVAISLLLIAVLAATVGATLPFIFHKMGFDPALMSAPFITTIVDILGILAYLNVAKLFLGI